MTTYPGDFEEHVRDLLSNLYDYLRLTDNPLAQQLALDMTGNERMHALRHTFLDAIDNLNSDKDAPLSSRQNRLYNILQLRYVEEQTTAEILSQLALSERQYYRDHQRAIQTISQIIWDKYFAEAAATGESTRSLIEELDNLQIAAQNRIFYPRDEILTAIEATRVIAERKGVSASVSDVRSPAVLNTAQPVFRQFIIYILNELIRAMTAGGKIDIRVGLREGIPSIEFNSGGATFEWEAFRAGLQADPTVSELMKRLNATLAARAEPGQTSHLLLKFDQEIQKILIVDDNPDTVSLFNRYLANLPYQLLATDHESDAMLIAQRTPLTCIILDIMLPGKDGWQILQSYKSHPLTADIPVLICSVLEMKELALSLGADGYIKKPPTRDEFLATLSQCVG